MAIDLNCIIQELETASSYELWRIHCMIDVMLTDPHRTQTLKQQLIPGMKEHHFDSRTNTLMEATVLQIKKTQAIVKNTHNQQRWGVPFYMLTPDETDPLVLYPTSQKKGDRSTFQRGDWVGWHSKFGYDLFGEIIKLNPKRAKIRLKTGEHWIVSYSMLFSVTEGSIATELPLLNKYL